VLDTLWSKFVLQLNKGNPFFACLALFTQVIPDESNEISVTCGKEIRINPDFILNQSDEKAFSYLLHQVLHLALQHNSRGRNRNAEVWNVAADIIVNDIIVSSTPWPTAPATAWDNRFSDCSVEQVYARLMEEFPETPDTTDAMGNNESELADEAGDLSGDPCDDSNGPAGSQSAVKGQSSDAIANGAGKSSRSISTLYQSHADLTQEDDTRSAAENTDDARYWLDATAQAHVAINGRQAGELPASLVREFERVARSNIDWQRELWRFVSERQSDFTEFDTRHIHRGLYTEQLKVDGLNISVAIDTSASVDDQELGVFMSELESIRQLYSDVQVSLYYCDTEVHGPYKLEARQENHHPPVGHGGTSFQPVFDSIKQLALVDRPDCLIYFTDGEADFPKDSGQMPTLWMLTSGGNCRESDIPFGRSLRMAPARNAN